MKSNPNANDRGRDFRSWWAAEYEDRARFAREAGFPGSTRSKSFYANMGNGSESGIAGAIWGQSPSMYQEQIYRQGDRYPLAYPDQGFLTALPEHSRYLTAGQFINGYSATAFANSMGMVFNVHLTITWGLFGVREDQAGSVLTHEVFKPLKSWLRERTSGVTPCVYLYVHEVGHTHGFHSHILLSIPGNLINDFRAWIAKRMKDILGTGAVPSNGFDVKYRSMQELKVQWTWTFQYLFKNLDPNAYIAAKCGTRAFVPAYRLICTRLKDPLVCRCEKKLGVSRNIDEAARRVAGFHSLLDLGIVNVDALYAGGEYLNYLRSEGTLDSSSDAAYLLEMDEKVRLFYEHEDRNRESYQRARQEDAAAHRMFLRIQKKIRAEDKRREEALRLLDLFGCRPK